MSSVVNSKELLSMYTDEFYKLTNKKEKHFGMKYKTGINTDSVPFNPNGECKPGGMYFFHISQLCNYEHYFSDPVYMRKVTFTSESQIYIEKNKFKTNEFILGEREFFSPYKYISKYVDKNPELALSQCGNLLEYLDDNLITDKLCKIAVEQNGLVLYHVKNQTDEICKLAVQQNSRALEYVKNQTDEICKLAVQKNGISLCYVRNKTYEICNLSVKQNWKAIQYVYIQEEELCILAVKQNGLALEYIQNQTEEICKLAVQQNGLALEYVQKQTDEICKLAIKQNINAKNFVKNWMRKMWNI